VSKVVVMQLLVEERVSAMFQQHDSQVGAHFVANAAVVDHRKGQLAIPTNTRNEQIKIKVNNFIFHNSRNGTRKL
jgi:uncharacterized membrane-anchored protein